MNRNDPLANLNLDYEAPADAETISLLKKIYIALYLSSFLLLFSYSIQLIILVLTATDSTSDELFLGYSIAPVFILALYTFSLVVGILINCLAGCSALRKARELLVFAFFSHFIFLPVMLAAFVILLLRGNGVVVLEGQNEISSAEFFNPEVSFDEFSIPVVEEIVKFTQDDDNAETWLDIQFKFNDCCGLNLVSLYADQVFGLNDFDRSKLLSSQQCQGAVGAAIDSFLDINPVFNDDTADDIEEAAEADAILGDPNFFCERFLANDLKAVAQSVAVGLGVSLFLQVAAVTCVGLLIYSYEEKYGGLKPTEADLAARARVENTVVAKAGFGTRTASLNRVVTRGSRPLKF
eukprot:snap_masked-scaffold_2-processed-gene-26.17-mRNA-1 protein AED:1.00 eAED:1.00 QI:0/-1/0/0/-1/1/1/0/350